MVAVSVSKELKAVLPGLTLSCIECDVEVHEENVELWTEIEQQISALAADETRYR